MEIRYGFVTNSSSTNHVIMWKGKKEDLLFILTQHRAHIESVLKKHKDWKTTASDVIQELLAQVENADVQYIGDVCPGYDMISNPRVGTEGEAKNVAAGEALWQGTEEFRVKDETLFWREEQETAPKKEGK